MEFNKKYIHVGYSYPSVPDPWKSIVKRAIVAIEKEMWPEWIPMFIKRFIHIKATGKSVVGIKSKFWYKIRSKLTKHQMIHQIKDKYASLCIYGHLNDNCYDIIDRAEDECSLTCEQCGSHYNVQYTKSGWIKQLCQNCRNKKE